MTRGPWQKKRWVQASGSPKKRADDVPPAPPPSNEKPQVAPAGLPPTREPQIRFKVSNVISGMHINDSVGPRRKNGAVPKRSRAAGERQVCQCRPSRHCERSSTPDPGNWSLGRNGVTPHHHTLSVSSDLFRLR